MGKNSFTIEGMAYKPNIKEGFTKNEKPYYMYNFGLKYSFGRSKTLLFFRTFNIKKGLTIEEGDNILVEGAVVYQNSYKDKEGNWQNQILYNADYARITNLTQGIILQEPSEPPVYKERAAEESSSDIPF